MIQCLSAAPVIVCYLLGCAESRAEQVTQLQLLTGVNLQRQRVGLAVAPLCMHSSKLEIVVVMMLPQSLHAMKRLHIARVRVRLGAALQAVTQTETTPRTNPCQLLYDEEANQV